MTFFLCICLFLLIEGLNETELSKDSVKTKKRAKNFSYRWIE